jgi:hypothetical protein
MWQQRGTVWRSCGTYLRLELALTFRMSLATLLWMEATQSDAKEAKLLLEAVDGNSSRDVSDF